MAAGAFAGIAEHTVMYPIDAIKTRMQILNPTPSAVYNGVIQGTYRIAAGEGVLSLWRGMSSVIVGAGPAHAVYFATYEAVKHVMGGNKAGVHHPLAAGESDAFSGAHFLALDVDTDIQFSSNERRLRDDC